MRGQQNEQSDIDILVDFYPEKESFDELMNLDDLLEQVLTNEKVEIVTQNGLSKHIGLQILNEVEYVSIVDSIP